jgi:hypothetical protein
MSLRIEAAVLGLLMLAAYAEMIRGAVRVVIGLGG